MWFPAPYYLLCVCGSETPFRDSMISHCRWAGVGRDGLEWGRVVRDGQNGVRWAGVRRSGARWDGVGWSGARWAGCAGTRLQGPPCWGDLRARLWGLSSKHSENTHGVAVSSGINAGQFSTAELTEYTSGDWLKLWIPALVTLTRGLCPQSFLLLPNTRLVRASLLTATCVSQIVCAVHLVRMKI